MAANRLAVLALAVLAGCGGDRGASMAADSLSRDLQRLPVDSSATLSDQAGATPVAAAPVAPAPAAPKPKPKPAARNRLRSRLRRPRRSRSATAPRWRRR